MPSDLKTLKDGRLFVTAEAGRYPSFAGPSAFSFAMARKQDGSLAYLVQEGDDLFWYDAASTIGVASASPSATINEATTVTRPVIFNGEGEDANLHVWYARDAGGGTDVCYRYSTNGGSTWTSEVVLSLVGSVSWAADQIVPVGFQRRTTGQHRLYCYGETSGAWTLGFFILNDFIGSFTSNSTNPADYQLPTVIQSGLGSSNGAVCVDDRGEVHFFWGATSYDGEILHANLGVSLRSSGGSSAYIGANPSVVMAAGSSGTRDDGGIKVVSAEYTRGLFHVLYVGFDGGSGYRPMLAVGESPDKLTKVPWLNDVTMAQADVYEVPFSGDVAFTLPQTAIHIPDRAAPGALRDGNFQQGAVSFSMLMTESYNESNTTIEALLDRLYFGRVNSHGVAGVDYATHEFNLIYQIRDGSGNPSSYLLWPGAALRTYDVTEAEDGTRHTFAFVPENQRYPLWGDWPT